MAARHQAAGQRQVERDAIALGVIESYFDSIITGELTCPSCKKATRFKELTKGAASLLCARYDKLRPSLSTIEQTIIDTRDELSEDALLSQLSALAAAKPALFARVIAIQREASDAIDTARDATPTAAAPRPATPVEPPTK